MGYSLCWSIQTPYWWCHAPFHKLQYWYQFWQVFSLFSPFSCAVPPTAVPFQPCLLLKVVPSPFAFCGILCYIACFSLFVSSSFPLVFANHKRSKNDCQMVINFDYLQYQRKKITMWLSLLSSCRTFRFILWHKACCSYFHVELL